MVWPFSHLDVQKVFKCQRVEHCYSLRFSAADVTLTNLWTRFVKVKSWTNTQFSEPSVSGQSSCFSLSCLDKNSTGPLCPHFSASAQESFASSVCAQQLCSCKTSWQLTGLTEHHTVTSLSEETQGTGWGTKGKGQMSPLK